MAARIKVDVTLAADEYDWGSPAANEVAICWSASKIHERKTVISKNDNKISSNRVKSIPVNVSNDKGKTKSHSFAKTSSGFVNTFILQGENYYRIGQDNLSVPVTAVSATIDTLTRTQSGSGAQVSVTQFASNWVLVKAQGSNWGNNNSCNHKRSRGSQHLKRNVNSIYDCAEHGVQAFDYDPSQKTCLLFKSNPTFSPEITHTSGRSKPGTQCYMLKTVYTELKFRNVNPEIEDDLCEEACERCYSGRNDVNEACFVCEEMCGGL